MIRNDAVVAVISLITSSSHTSMNCNKVTDKDFVVKANAILM